MLRHGDTRRQLLGVEAVLADGSVVSHLGGLEKDNTGYDLAGLLCGSEGTLGVVTAARLRLVPARPTSGWSPCWPSTTPAPRSTAAQRLRRDLPDASTRPSCSSTAGSTWSARPLGLRPPVRRRPRGVPARRGGRDRRPHRRPGRAPSTGSTAWPTPRSPPTAPRRAELWRYREAHTEAINTLGPPHKLDVTLPGPALAPFLDEVAEVVRPCAPGARTWLFGHAADGNIHVNVTGVDPGDEAVDDAVLRLVVDAGRVDQRRARHRHGQAPLAPARPLARRRSPPCGPSSTPSTPPASSTPECCSEGLRVRQSSSLVGAAGLETLPVPVRGSSASRITSRGRLEAGQPRRARARAARRAPALRPGRSTT